MENWGAAEINSYLNDFNSFLRNIKLTDFESRDIELHDGIKRTIDLILALGKSGGTLIFIGNGGSAAIASHQATDFIRSCGIKAFAPLDHSLLTCMGNDHGYEHVFSEPLKVIAKKEDVLMAISSSGRSANIIRAVQNMRERKLKIITLSGFNPDNPLRKSGDVNFYVPSNSYRIVESAHLFICNWILDFTLRSKEALKEI
ncbi:MAG: SIS domain-containing protein [Patescibacteria group bacterium]